MGTKRTWNPKNPEAVTKEDIKNMTTAEKTTWELDRYCASHGIPRGENNDETKD